MSERKASDVLLELEVKINKLLEIQQAQDLNIKVLSNRLTSLMDSLNKKNVEVALSQPKVGNGGFSISAEDINVPTFPATNIVDSEEPLKITDNPVGFRRTSRPDIQNKISEDHDLFKEVEEGGLLWNPNKTLAQKKEDQSLEIPSNQGQKVSVSQRVLDRNEKAVFLAQVEIVNLVTGEKLVTKPTSGVGRWNNNLVPGKYRITISKRESVSKSKIEVSQDILVDGKTNVLELPTLVV